MSASRDLLQRHILDLLIDGPSSFAALFGALGRHYYCGHEVSVDMVFDALVQMEEKGWLRVQKMTEQGLFHHPTDEDRRNALHRYRAWLQDALRRDLALDEVGLWYEITPIGRGEWEHWSAEDEERRAWVLDDVVQSQTISVQAETVEVAEEALRGWLSSNPSIELVEESKAIEQPHEFEMRDGTVILNGVRLVCTYRRRTGSGRC